MFFFVNFSSIDTWILIENNVKHIKMAAFYEIV